MATELPLRSCLKCRKQFQPPSRFIFMCNECHKSNRKLERVEAMAIRRTNSATNNKQWGADASSEQ
jgi:hypothetical protein